jgi:sugar O-acyltransferase (sialic acid O-acetyltransferase NeuD family)
LSGVPLLLVGAGGHARSCIDVIEQQGKFEVAGLVGTPDQIGSKVLGYPVLGTDTDLPELLRIYAYALVTVGQIKTPKPRIQLFNLLRSYWCALPVVISPRAHVSRHAVVESGTIVMHGAIVNAGATVGKNCILNSQSLVEHDSVVSDHCHIATGVALNSSVYIGEGTFVGSNAAIRQGVRIGEHCVIGMGVRVLAECPSHTQIPPVRNRGPVRPSNFMEDEK